MSSNDSFTITAPPNTDAWRKPPIKDTFNSPSKRFSDPFPLSSFSGARITFSASWTEIYDQGGLLFTLKRPDYRTKWLKCGTEFYQDRTFVSTVATDNFSDWSIYPADLKDGEQVTVELIREGSEHGEGLWVYWLKLNENGAITERIPLREVCWFFHEQEKWSVEVGAYAARPSTNSKDGLEVTFSDFKVDRK